MSSTYLWLALCLLGVVIVGAALLKKAAPKSPYRFKKKALMTPNEKEFYQRILNAVDGKYAVLCQVSMGALMTGTHASGKHVYARMKFAQKIVDYALMDTCGDVKILIELDDKMHDRKKDRERDAMTNEAGYITLRFESRNKPSIAELRIAISGAGKK